METEAEQRLAHRHYDGTAHAHESARGAEPQQALPHQECLVKTLPTLGRIEADALEEAKTSARAANLQAAMSSELDFQPPPASPDDERSAKGKRRSSAAASGPGAGLGTHPSQAQTSRPLPPMKPLQPYDVFRAIEKKNLELLFRARDTAFQLLVTPHGGVLPLVHCLRLGHSHRDVAILITGALSRFVNNTPADQPLDKARRPLLSKVRSNLKIAINESLHTRQTDLISSYLQVILMTEGDAWLVKQTQLLALALRQGRRGQPVQTAQEAVRKFATQELKSMDKLAAVEEYTANASIDLVLMGLWSVVLDAVGGQRLPLYQFARECVLSPPFFFSFAMPFDQRAQQKAYARAAL